MKFKIELLEADKNYEPHEEVVEIFNTEENELTLRSGDKEHKLLKSAFQIGMNEMFLYGWLAQGEDVFKVRYKLTPVIL